MNFNYSYRAFLISSLLFGCLFTILFGVKIKSNYIAEEEEGHEIQYDAEILQEDQLAQNELEQYNVETNRAYNEAEAFIREQENLREQEQLATPGEDKNQVTETQGDTSSEESITFSAQETAQPAPEKTIKNSATRTTIKYSLIERTALQLPNPVYTCASGGKVVINIEVNDFGKVLKASYNKKASTTENGCLIDSAIAYAKASKFTSKGGKKKQLGTISYSFPGQQN